MKRNFILALALAALVAVPAQAQDILTSDPTLPTTRTGTRGAAFLALGVGARAQALGGAYTSLANDVSALYWNTSGIAHLDGFSAQLSQANIFEGSDITHTFVGAVMPVGLSRFGLSVNILSSGDMAWTAENYPNPEPFGDDFNPTQATFEWTSMAIGLHYARPVTDRLVFGFAGKYIEEGIGTVDANFIGFDLGAQFETGLYGLTLGAALTNLGTSGEMEGTSLAQRVNTGTQNTSGIYPSTRVVEFRPNTEDLELPTAFHFSVMADLIGSASSILSPSPDNNLRLVWDLSDAVNTDLRTAVGMEYSYRELAFVRLGKQWTNEAQISYDFTRGAALGGGVHLPLGDFGRVMLDYAYTGMGELENIQVFSLEVQF